VVLAGGLRAWDLLPANGGERLLGPRERAHQVARHRGLLFGSGLGFPWTVSSKPEKWGKMIRAANVKAEQSDIVVDENL